MATPGSFKKGEKRPNQGKRGPGKETAALREMILSALHEQDGGGVEYLKTQAIAEPVAFMSLLGKVLPTTLATAPGEPLEMRHSVGFEGAALALIDAIRGAE